MTFYVALVLMVVFYVAVYYMMKPVIKSLNGKDKNS